MNTDAGSYQRSLMHNSKGEDVVAPCISDLSLFIGMNRTDSDLNLPAQNIWHLSKEYGWNHDEAFKSMLSDTSTAASTPFLFISNESAKDRDFSLRHPGKSTSEIICLAKFDTFEPYADTSHETRGKDYLDLKEQLTEIYLDAFYLHFPQARGHVEFKTLGTPLTMNKFLGRQRGEVYALDHDISRFDSFGAQRALHPQTSVRHLFLTGQDACFVSVTGCMISGYITAARASWPSWFGTLPLLAKGLCQIFFGK